MADIVFNPIAGVPFSGGVRMKDLGDGTYAPISMGVAGFQPVLSISNQSALTNGTMLDNTGVRNNHSCMVITTGTVTTGGAVQLQGSQDNVNWVNLLGGSGFQQGVIVPVSGTSTTWLGTAQLTPFRYIRAAITTVIPGGGTISAWIASAG
jgi:hypothetical protein